MTSNKLKGVFWDATFEDGSPGTLEKYDPEDNYPYVDKEGTAWMKFTPLMQGFTTGEDE